MLIEQEVMSIMNFALKYADNPNPYYWDIPENFAYPAMYFPQPEIMTGGETFRTYAMDYSWYINIFHKTSEEAFELAWKVLTELKQKRNLVPLLNEDGSYAGSGVRLNDPSAKLIETGVAQLTLSWVSRRPYDREVVQKMMKWYISDLYLKEVIKNGNK